jgi:DNA polymerase
MKEEISSGIVVYREENGARKYLLLNRREGFLDFPKGHIEAGENEETAAERETLEETGLHVKPLPGFRKETVYWFRAPALTEEEKEQSVSQYAKKRANRELIHKRLVMFLGKAPHGEEPEVSVEHTGFQWLDYERCLSLLRYDNQKELLGEAEKFLSAPGK